IAVIVVTYNIAINLNEVIWKHQVNQLYPNPNDFQAYMGKVLVGIGLMATVIALFSGYFLRKFSWTFNAMIPPFILLITGAGFFSFLLFKEAGFGSAFLLFGSSPLLISVFFGSLQNILARATKYTVFDTTKELSFIPLSRESKLKGKAAIDGIGSRVGKSGGAIIYQVLLMLLGTISVSIPYVGFILLFVIGAWMLAVRSLGKQFNALMSTQATVDIADLEQPELEKTGAHLKESAKKQEVTG
ncbi:MAG: Npt1/Npt2 family nucleotide transporter, partial [Anaerolineae bacterium]